MENASRDRYVPDSSRHFAPDADRAPAMRKCTIGNDHILAGNTFRPARGVITRLDCNTIIAAVDKTVGDPYVCAGFRIDPIRIRRIIRLNDLHGMDIYVPAVDRVDGPGRR